MVRSTTPIAGMIASRRVAVASCCRTRLLVATVGRCSTNSPGTCAATKVLERPVAVNSRKMLSRGSCNTS
jgi:hypothetical protein